MEKNRFEQEIINCLGYLREGKLIQFPTDTGWVLACDASNDQSVRKLKDLGHSGSPGQMIILLADERDLLKYVSSLDLEVFNFLDQQEIPVAIYFNGVLGISEETLNSEYMAAFRIVKEDFSRHLLKRFRKPVAVIPVSSCKFPGTDYQAEGLPPESGFGELQLVKWSPGEVTILPS